MLVDDGPFAELVLVAILDGTRPMERLAETLEASRARVALQRTADQATALARITELEARGVRPDMVILTPPVSARDVHHLRVASPRDMDDSPLIIIALVEDRSREALEGLLAAGVNAVIDASLGPEDQRDLEQTIIDYWFHGDVTSLAEHLGGDGDTVH